MTYSNSQIVEALYVAVLNRQPDAFGLSSYSKELEESPDNLLRIASSFHESDEHKRLMSAPRGLPDHSQHGEFAKILKQMMRRGSRHNIIVDVGARGRERSNSFDLLTQFQWYGLLIEANPELYSSIKAEFANTRFNLVECAIGAKEGVLPLYIGSNDDVSSLSREAAAGWGDLRGQVDVNVRRLAPVLSESGIPHDFDVLSLDIEGHDVPVLNDLITNSAYRPRCIVIEAVHGPEIRSPDEIGASDVVSELYDVSDLTTSNVFLSLK